MISAIVLAVVASTFARPPENIQYADNITLIYDGDKITNLDKIDQLHGVEPGMATILKKAVLDALPSYLKDTQHKSGASDSDAHKMTDQSEDAKSSETDATSSESEAETEKDKAHSATQTNSTEDFWNRSDLVHYLVSIETATTASATATSSTTSPTLDLSTTVTQHVPSSNAQEGQNL